MPAFISNGPDIPEHLIQAHEDGKVIFFCGAGISYRADLPGFEGLVDDIYKALGTKKTNIEKKAYDTQQYDAQLHQLERRYPGQRTAVRKVLGDVLKPKWRKKGATETHQSLLQLATDRNGVMKLVTTNFDHIFERAAKKNKVKISSYSAPLLPIPKQSRWDGIVYLHGVMPRTYDEAALNRLILTSGDFGLAYLTERWAARFVSQLFKDYTVCFVGYSINDPVLRYMMDALAADELQGEVKPEAYAFASYRDGSEEDSYNEWEAKGVTPLLYNVPHGTHDHSALYETLKEWSNTYHDGIRGKEMVITKHASNPPLASSRLDFAVGRVLWALSNSLAAKHFSELVPIPPLDWLKPFSEKQFKYVDLPKFGITPHNNIDEKLLYSYINHPSPYTHAPRMSLVDFRQQNSRWDEVMNYIANWLLRHLGDPQLILWLIKNGGELNEQFKDMVERRINELDRLIADGKENELKKIISESPKCIPSSSVKTLWRIILKGRVRTGSRRMDLFGWLRRLKYEGVTSTLLVEFRELLAPCIVIREPSRWGDKVIAEEPEDKAINDIVNWELVLACDHVHSTLIEDLDKEELQSNLSQLLNDVTLLLKDALDLSSELGGANDKSDLSYIHQPSISKHEQNKGFRDWTALIELARESWLATVKIDCNKATKIAEDWWDTPYPLFKRMAMFAAVQGSLIGQDKAIKWILENNGWWLWSVETQREFLRLLVFLSPQLSESNRVILEQKILLGPPREMYKDELEQDRFKEISERHIWHLLIKLKISGGQLGNAAAEKLNELTQKFPEWDLSPNEQDEFPYWMGSTEWVGEKEAPPEFELAPSTRSELVEWLRKNPSSERLHHQDGWKERCRENTGEAIGALLDLATQNDWLIDRWSDVLQVAIEVEFIQPVWKITHEALATAPEQFIESNARSLSYWLKTTAKTFEGNDEDFFTLCNRLLGLDYKDDDIGEPVSVAINHPVGHVIEALLNWWYRKDLKDNQGLHQEIKKIFIDICNTNIRKYSHGRVILAAHAISLFRVDESWTKEYLLPLFDWNLSEVEARSAWEGFLWSPRLYLPFLAAIKVQLLETAKHYNEVDKHGEQYASFLTFLALDPGDAFSIEELSIAIEHLPAEGLRVSASTLSRALDGTKEQQNIYWNNRVKPFIKNCWPKTCELLTPEISESIARVCVSAKGSFDEAVHEFQYWLKPVEYPDYLIHILHEAKLSAKFPNEALMYLDALIGSSAEWIPKELKQCLDAIGQAAPNLVSDARYVRLIALARKRGVN